MSVTGCQPIEGDGYDGFVCYTGNNSLAAIRERLDALTPSEQSGANPDAPSGRLGAESSNSSTKTKDKRHARKHL